MNHLGPKPILLCPHCKTFRGALIFLSIQRQGWDRQKFLHFSSKIGCFQFTYWLCHLWGSEIYSGLSSAISYPVCTPKFIFWSPYWFIKQKLLATVDLSFWSSVFLLFDSYLVILKMFKKCIQHFYMFYIWVFLAILVQNGCLQLFLYV